MASDSIDESGFFGIGGPGSIRAFPTGEVSGPEGWFAQLELRYTFHDYGATPYVFYDTGSIKKTKESDGTSSRSISGYGLGLKYNRFGIDFDAVAAWQGSGGPAVGDPDDREPRLWISVTKTF